MIFKEFWEELNMFLEQSPLNGFFLGVAIGIIGVVFGEILGALFR